MTMKLKFEELKGFCLKKYYKKYNDPNPYDTTNYSNNISYTTQTHLLNH